MYDNFETISVEKANGILRVEMAATPEISDDMIDVFRRANDDNDVRVIVLTGAAERSFCVGGGAGGAPSDEAGRNAYWIRGMRRARELILSLLDCDKPILGRINGHAVGKGCSIALCCDVTLMVEDSKIGDTHVNVGLVAGDGGSLLWPGLVGAMVSKRFLLTGDLMTGKEAAAIGLVTEAVPRSDLDTRTEYWIERLSRGSPAAVAMTKRALNSSIRQQAIVHMDMSLGLESLSFMTEDHRAGVAALKEKRKPTFEGR